MRKRGQTILGMSFGTIFSIILIIFIISVAVYGINYFLGLNKCAQVGLFYDEFEGEIEKAWVSGSYNGEFEREMPKSGFFGTGVEWVCFGKITDSAVGDDEDRRKKFEFDYDASADMNVFMDPPEKACDGDLFSYHLECGKSECMDTGGQFFCVEVVDNKIKVNIEKGNTDSVVLVS